MKAGGRRVDKKGNRKEHDHKKHGLMDRTAGVIVTDGEKD